MRTFRRVVLMLMALGFAGTAWAAQSAGDFTADGRWPIAQLMARYDTLVQRSAHGSVRGSARGSDWTAEIVYAYPEEPALAIRAWRTRAQGPALWVISGIHGEEPAGPNAIARQLPHLAALARQGVPIVLIPLANPKAYRNNWRYPNTAERDWRQGGYSVGDAEALLRGFDDPGKPRDAASPGPETQALTRFVLQLAKSYPPRVVLDLHEDELSTSGGYIYSQGTNPHDNPVGAEAIRLLRASGIPIRDGGQTRFGETIRHGVISRDDQGGPIRDGSIDELLASEEVLVDGVPMRGPAASTVIVVETPAFAGSRFDLRAGAHGRVVQNVARLWQLGTADAPSPTATALEQDLVRIANSINGVVGVAAWRLDGRGPRVFLNGTQRFPMASTYKVAIAGAILAGVEAGRLGLGQMVTVEPRHLVPSEVIADNFLHPGVSLSVHNLLELMLTHSDNTATDVLMELAGGPAAVTAWVHGQGVDDLRVDRDTNQVIRQFLGVPSTDGETLAQILAAHPELEAATALPNIAFDRDPQDSTTPTAMATLLTRIFSGQALGPAGTAVITDIMARCRTGANRLAGRLPPTDRVAHKTGTIGGSVNDVGVITLPGNAGKVVIAVYLKQSDAAMSSREQVIADIARSVRDFYLYLGY